MCARCPPKVHFSGKTTIQTRPQIHIPSQEADPVEDVRKITLEAMLKTEKLFSSTSFIISRLTWFILPEQGLLQTVVNHSTTVVCTAKYFSVKIK